jgi:two-component system, OmpR family, sensor histidine kinase VicK
MKSIKLKLVIIYLIIVFMVMIVSGTFMLTSLNIRETNKAKNSLEDFSRMVYEQIVGRYEPNEFQYGFDELRTIIGTASNPIQSSILTGSADTIIASNTSTELDYINSTVISAVAGTESFGTNTAFDVDGINKNWINHSLPILDENGDVIFIVFSRIDQGPILETLTQFAITLFFTLLLSLLMTAVLGYLFANTITVPITGLTKRAKQIAVGNLSEVIPVNSSDEIGQLTKSFNDMSKNLSQTIDTMISEKNKLEILLHNMNDGVLAYDSNENIIHANEHFYALIDIEQSQNISFLQMMDKFNIEVSNINDFTLSEVKDKLVSIKDKYVRASFSTYLNNSFEIEGLLIVLQDITKDKKLDDMRKEFVANVSHEIRTPLTNIKSYTETLINGAIEDSDLATSFLEVINSETDRMTLLVRDLLELSSFDSNQLTLTMESVDLKEIIKQCISQNLILANNKNQQIYFDYDKEPYYILCEPKRINQVITNIINNAIKYSEPNTTIIISTHLSKNHYTVYIKDTGVGIPKEDLKLIFERFYRVDKARSRAMGGTGLGLAIAKEIMELHGGKIYATSYVGEGTTMVLKFLKFNEVVVM